MSELVGLLRYARTKMSHEAVLEVGIIPLYICRQEVYLTQSEVFDDSIGKENVECEACPPKTRDAKDMQRHERLVHENSCAVYPNKLKGRLTMKVKIKTTTLKEGLLTLLGKKTLKRR